MCSHSSSVYKSHSKGIISEWIQIIFPCKWINRNMYFIPGNTLMSLWRFFSVRHSDCVISHQEKSKVNFLMMDGAGTEDKPLKIPKEVWILVNHLFTKSCDQVRRPQLIKHSLQQKDVYHWQVWQWTWGMKLIDVVVLIHRNVWKKTACLVTGRWVILTK